LLKANSGENYAIVLVVERRSAGTRRRAGGALLEYRRGTGGAYCDLGGSQGTLGVLKGVLQRAT
jgi:hypothetical protein